MQAAERMLQEGAYFAACSDAHKSADVEAVGEALKLLQRIVGEDRFRQLLILGPAKLIEERDA
jgi:protein-tyrosine phosphatase